jgi:hypothetical protein
MIRTRDFDYVFTSYDIRDQASIKELFHWFQKQPFFIFQFQLQTPTPEYYSHIVFVKKNGLKQLELIDSLGNDWNGAFSIMDSSIAALINIIFTRLNYSFSSRVCPRVQSYSSCSLWSLYFSIFNEKSPQQAITLINKILDKNKIQVSSDPKIKIRQREAVICILFQYFVGQGWILPAGIDIAEYKKGLGRKCRKCGLNKF